METKFLKFQSLILSLIPAFLISGPFISDLAISTISISMTIYLLRKKNYTYFLNNFFLIFMIFYFYILINSIFINSSLDSIRISTFYFRFGLFSVCFWYLLDHDKFLLKKIFIVMFFCFLFLIVDGFIQFLFGKNLLGFTISETGRISSFFNEELVMGSYLSRLFPIFFGLAIFLFNKKNNYLIWVSIIFIFVETLIFISGERSALFYMNLSAVYIILCIKNFKKLRIITLAISLFLIVIISFLNPSYKERVIDFTADQMGINLQNDKNLKIDENKKYLFSKQHTHHYLSAKKMFESNILFGVGVRNFKNLCHNEEFKISEISCSSHPHNTYIQLLAETGIIGFLIIFSFLIYFSIITLRYLIYSYKKGNYLLDFQICIVSALIISLWPFIPTGNFFNNWLSIIYYFPVGIFLWTAKNLDKSIKI